MKDKAASDSQIDDKRTDILNFLEALEDLPKLSSASFQDYIFMQPRLFERIMSGTNDLELQHWCTENDLPQDKFLFDNSDILCSCDTGGGVLPVKFYLGTLLPPLLYEHLENMVRDQRKFRYCCSFMSLQ